MPSIKSLTFTYDALNEYGTFSEGDTITGAVILVLSKECKIGQLVVKAKGDAEVRWTKKQGEQTHTYSSHRRYFKLKQFFIQEETVLPPGNHIHKFRITLPRVSMPSSFKGSHGKIAYQLEVKLSRSWRSDWTEQKEIKFVSKSVANIRSLMSQKIGSANKDMGFFSKGHVHMDVTVDKSAYAAGERAMVVAKVNNSSSSQMTPKFSLIRDVVYRANGNTKHETLVCLKVVDNCIKAHTETEVRCPMQIPSDTILTIQNCEIISVEYHLKVYLDISFAFDPEVVIPVVILPPDYQSSIAGAANSDFPPTVVFTGPYPVSPRSPSNGYPGVQNPPMYPQSVYPPLPTHMSGAYNNPVPQVPSPYPSPSPYSSPSSSRVLHPPPSAPQFHPPPVAPQFHPPPSAPEIQSPPSAPEIQSPPSYQPPTGPAYNPLPSAPTMSIDFLSQDFLSQTDDGPPSYSLLFPSSTTDTSDAK
ncbi:arrestin domain-containing protein 3-like [Mugil cephalus]|uniref:arrestin domain-containing protein 3-like n=1 Tax=Mugil cephalus TaxID=48193 RepID=UPI001FB60594|nr:arrestin domain-containing protein 3-like [Mugil cephalus]